MRSTSAPSRILWFGHGLVSSTAKSSPSADGAASASAEDASSARNGLAPYSRSLCHASSDHPLASIRIVPSTSSASKPAPSRCSSVMGSPDRAKPLRSRHTPGRRKRSIGISSIVAPFSMMCDGASTCVPVCMLMVMSVLRMPSSSSVVSGSSRGHGWPGTGIVLSENGIVRSRLLLIARPPRSFASQEKYNIILNSCKGRGEGPVRLLNGGRKEAG